MNAEQAAEYIAELDKAVEELRSGKLGEILPPQRIDDRLRVEQNCSRMADRHQSDKK